jgi:hypothetical protein
LLAAIIEDFYMSLIADIKANIKAGKKLRFSLTSLCDALDLSAPTIYRRLNIGDFIQFTRDPITKRIFFDAQDILAYLESTPKYQSTAQYDHDGCQKMEIARSAKNKSSGTKQRNRRRRLPRLCDETF